MSDIAKLNRIEELEYEANDLRRENQRLRAERALGAKWEVEGFIDRLMRRDGANSERLVLEAISHLRAFSRDCDALRADNERLRAVIVRAKDALLDGQSTQWVHDLLIAAILDGEKE